MCCMELVTLLWRGSEWSLASPCFEHLSLPLQRILVCFPVTVIITKTKSDLGKKGSTWLVLPDQNPSLMEVGAEGPGSKKHGGKLGWRDLGSGSLEGSQDGGTQEQEAWRAMRQRDPGAGSLEECCSLFGLLD